MSDPLLPLLLAVVILGAVVLALVQNARQRAGLREVQARYDRATEEGLAANREALENQRRMLALFEEMNATLRRIEAARGGDPLSR